MRPRTGTLPATAAAAALLCAAPSCAVPDLTRASEVVRLRVLAVQAEPPEIALGETTTFSYLLGNPEGVEVENLWLLCTEIDTGLGSTVCGSPIVVLQDPFADTYSFTASPETPIGQETGEDGETVDVLLGDALADLEPVRRVEGIGFKVYLAVMPADDFDAFYELLTEAFSDPDAALEDLEQVLADLFAVVAETGELATKRVVVSDKTALDPAPTSGCEDLDGLAGNLNPTLSGVARVDPETLQPLGEVTDGGVFAVTPGESVTLEPRLAEGAVERYYYVRIEDEGTECRTEEPLFGWYSTAGEFDADYSFVDEDGTLGEIVFTAPDVAEEQRIDAWLVTWDRRGGIDWLSFTFEVAPR